ncbi:hypothetical protein B0F90DRAFT_1890908 [Multifurca ochricompacta]|uniref:Uncharacterized protein n=1 Tax=Multifurca ochricompacta TaxID=376703 RepID=A0AAD4LZQ3_9AGAM|nr:hypothetical protein B0F90DRAFT_1890908 [Multifurca ochricompacta]
MKQALHLGSGADLNIYTVGFTSGERLLGYATFPDAYRSDTKMMALSYSILLSLMRGSPTLYCRPLYTRSAIGWDCTTPSRMAVMARVIMFMTLRRKQNLHLAAPKAVILARPQVWTLFTTTWTTR